MHPAATRGPIPPRTQTGTIGARQDRLQQNERGIRTDTSTRLVAHGDQAIASGSERGRRPGPPM